MGNKIIEYRLLKKNKWNTITEENSPNNVAIIRHINIIQSIIYILYCICEVLLIIRHIKFS